MRSSDIGGDGHAGSAYARSKTAPAGEGRCVVLGEGVEVPHPQCCCCGREFPPPRSRREKFRVAVPVFEKTLSSELPPRLRSWMLLGPRVVVAAANPRLNAQLSQSVVFIGEKVAVARAKSPAGDRRSYLFCDECGRNLLSHVELRQERNYRWDFLADLRPCNLVDKIVRWLERPKTAPAI